MSFSLAGGAKNLLAGFEHYFQAGEREGLRKGRDGKLERKGRNRHPLFSPPQKKNSGYGFDRRTTS